MKKIFFLILLIPYFFLQAQQYAIRGSVKDIQSNENLGYANIRISGSMIGTAANIEGNFELKLKPGKYVLIASYIGYYSDTIAIELDKDISDLQFGLSETDLPLPEIVILPGENPALEIIRKAIEKRKERYKKINSYEFEAYTKGIVRTENDFGAKGNQVSLGVGVGDSSELKITGILENQSKGYFLKPDNYKEIILARKQSANFPSSINIVTGRRIMQNFYDGDVSFFDTDLPGPLSDNALDYYYFYIDKVLALDNQKVFKIYMATESSVDPGFQGSIFITDSTYDLIKVDLQLNRAANIGGIFDTINVFQQFRNYDGIFMPADYRIFLKANFLGLARVGFELNSVLYDYKINAPLNPDDFSNAIVTVVPEADKKDSLYWVSSQTIPNTLEEEKAYERIDSLSKAPVTFWDRFSFLSTRTYLSENLAANGTLNLYHFNRVEGHALKLGLYANDYFEQRLDSYLDVSYGFSDKKVKTVFGFTYLLGNYRTYSIRFNAYNTLKTLFENYDSYSDFTATLLALINKEEFRDYYYSNGFDLRLTGEVFPVLELSAGFINKTDKSASANSDFSFFRKDKMYPPNQQINDIKINAITAGFKLDFRKYIEDGYFRRRTSLGKSNIIFYGDVTYSNSGFLNSGLDFTTYHLYINSYIKTFRTANLSMRFFGMYNDGTLPYQYLYALPGNLNGVSKNFTFRTLRISDVFGDRVATLRIEHDFRDEIFRLLNIPGLRSWEISLNLFLNAALTGISDKTRYLLPTELKTFAHPFYEIGFGIGQGIIPLQLEFAWKLNYRGSNNFVISANIFAL